MKVAKKKGGGIIPKVSIAIILVAIIAVVVTVIVTNLFENHYFANQKFEELSRNYYENSLYESFITEHSGEDLGEAFSKYTSGFTVRLRQILNFEFLEHDANYRSYFDTDSFTCDTNKSNVVFKPHAPYGKKDYDAEFNLICSKI